MSTRIRLTPELERQILAAIRSGGYAHVAAAAWGVPEAVWEQWRRWSSGRRARQPYRQFFLQVQQAEAQVRLRAEIDALQADPRSWLKHGPGKEQPHNPGWSTLARPRTPSAGPLDVFASPDFLHLLAALRTALFPYPDALAAVTHALQEAGVEKRPSSRRRSRGSPLPP